MMHPPARLAWAIWGLGSLVYLAAFFQRVAPAVMTEQLMAEFALGGAALGNLSAFYFYAYVAMQIPTGLLADRWGPRKLLASGTAVATLGGALIRLYKALPYVRSAEVLVVTSSPADVRALSMIGDRTLRQMDAWNKMTTELVRECEACEFNDVCSQVEDFRAGRRALQERAPHV